MVVFWFGLFVGCGGLVLLLLFCFVFKNVLDQCLGFSRV